MTRITEALLSLRGSRKERTRLEKSSTKTERIRNEEHPFRGHTVKAPSKLTGYSRE